MNRIILYLCIAGFLIGVAGMMNSYDLHTLNQRVNDIEHVMELED